MTLINWNWSRITCISCLNRIWEKKKWYEKLILPAPNVRVRHSTFDTKLCACLSYDMHLTILFTYVRSTYLRLSLFLRTFDVRHSHRIRFNHSFEGYIVPMRMQYIRVYSHSLYFIIDFVLFYYRKRERECARVYTEEIPCFNHPWCQH